MPDLQKRWTVLLTLSLEKLIIRMSWSQIMGSTFKSSSSEDAFWWPFLTWTHNLKKYNIKLWFDKGMSTGRCPVQTHFGGKFKVVLSIWKIRTIALEQFVREERQVGGSKSNQIYNLMVSDWGRHLRVARNLSPWAGKIQLHITKP